MPIPVAYAAGVGASVAFEYSWHRLKGERATTKELVTAAVLGALPLAKLRVLRSPLRAARWKMYRKTDDLRHLVFMGTKLSKKPVKLAMGAASPFVGVYWVGSPLASYVMGRTKRRLFSAGYDLATGGKKMATKRYNPRG